jgi:HEAT repeat protein
MSAALATTFRVLAETENEAAVRVLIAALDSRHAAIQEGALRAVLARGSPAGGRELLRRLHNIPQRWREIVRGNPGRMTGALRDAILGTDPQMLINGCRAAVWLREYDLIPTLLSLLEDPRQQHADLAGKTLLEVSEQLYEELAAPRDYGSHRDPQLVREQVVSSLEASVRRFDRHRRREAIEAFLLVVGRDNVTLRQILRDPLHVSYLTTIDVLSGSPRSGVMRLLLNLLDDPQAPSAALSAAAGRTDLKFVRYLLGKIGPKPSATVARNLKHVESIAWLRSAGTVLGQLDDAAQQAAVQLVMASAAPRLQAFSMIQYLVLHGRPGGRRAAAAALREFRGAAANNLVLAALEDPDLQVQAAAVAHLRHRGIPGSFARLVGLVDSPHAAISAAAREQLGEFSFQRFLRAFDVLDDEVRRSNGLLVKKIDPQTVPLLEVELGSLSRTRRLRGLAIAQTIEVAEELEPLILELLEDEDHLIRARAAATLGRCRSAASRHALQNARGDSSQTVQEAAQQALAEQAQLSEWPEPLSTPRD